MKLTNNILLFIIFGSVLTLLFITPVHATNLDNTLITYDSYVVMTGENLITVTARDATNATVADAVVEIFVYSASSPSFYGTWVNSGNIQADTPVQNTTLTNGEASFVWQAPDITNSPNPQEIVSFNVTVTSDTDRFTKTIDITVVKTATDLSLSTIETQYMEVYPNIPVLITATAITPGLGLTSNVNVLVTSDFGTFTQDNQGFTDDNSVFQTYWKGADVVDITPVHINATFQEGDNDLFIVQTTITLYPTNLTASLVNAQSTSLTSGDRTTLTLEAKGPLGLHIPNTQVELSTQVGVLNTTSIPDIGNDGIAYVEYTAPSVLTTTNDTITVTFASNGLTYQTSITLLVAPKIYDLTIQLNTTSVDIGGTVMFTVTVKDNSNPVPGVTVQIAGSAGYFLSTNDTAVTRITNSSGIIVAYWIANVTSFIGTGSDYIFTITAQDTSSGVAQENVQVHVNSPELNTTVTVTFSKQQIQYDDVVYITIQAMRFNTAYENASVYIFAEFGYFLSSGTEQAIGITNATGQITFEWHTGLSKLEDDYVTTFQVKVTFYDPPELIEQNPTLLILGQQSTQSSGNENNETQTQENIGTQFDTTTSIIIAILVALGVLAAGAFLLLRSGR